MIKAVVFDFDGTLTKESKGNECWYKTWEFLQDLPYDHFLYTQYTEKKITETEWAQLAIKRFQEKNLRYTNLLYIASTIQLLPGVKETFKYLHEQNINIYILSGGIYTIIENVLKQEKVLSFITAIEAYQFQFDKKENLVACHSPKLHNIENKYEYIQLLKTQHNLKGNEILFVGNSFNAETVYKSGVHTLCIHPHHTDITNKIIWQHSIPSCKNLTEILPFVQMFT